MRLAAMCAALSCVLAAAIDVKDPIVPELTTTNFKATVAKGLWFVKHYSPSCPHCVKLAPFWEKAGEKYAPLAKTRDFHFGSVNCMLQGDLCHENGIKHYPMLFLFKDGVKVDEWINTGDEDPLIPISEFVDKKVDEFADNTSMAEKVGETPTPVAAKPLTVKDFDTPKVTPNPSGTSINLTPETFTQLVTGTKSPWMIKFYAPWCSHCKAMAPAWSELASEFKGRLNVGEVDCDAQKRLCADVKVKGYPTILFFEGEKHIEYSGLRGVGDLIAFGKKAINAVITDVDAADFEALEKTSEVLFLYFYDAATTSEDFEALERTSLELIGHSQIVKTSSSILASRFRTTTFPKLTVIRDGKPQYFPALGPADMRDHHKMLSWMKTAWLPIVPELSVENSHEIMQNKLVVLAVLDPASSAFDGQKTLMKDVAYGYLEKKSSEEQADKKDQRDKKQTKIDEAEKKGDQRAIEQAKNIHVKVNEHPNIGFAWVNGVFWEKWLQASYQIDIDDGARVIIYDESSKRYWDQDSRGSKLEFLKSAILDTLVTIMEHPNKIKSKSTKTSLEAAYHAARAAGTGHPYLLAGIAFSLLIGVVYLSRRSSRIALPVDRERGVFSDSKYD